MIRQFILVLTLSVMLCPTVAAQRVASTLPDFAALVRANKAAVVNISIDDAVTQLKKNNDGDSEPEQPEDEKNPSNDKSYEEFLEEFQGELPDFGTQSLGSGFVVSADGYILTCAHVIEDASRVIVRFSNRKEYEAEVVGKDKRSDVAVLKVDAQNLETVEIGDPSDLEVGEWVLAIGSPFGFDSSATSGIVSAKGRSLPNESYVPFIQTDVAINPGNSGGPLFDLNGKVVGINAQIYSRTGGFMGLSFAVPIDLAMRVSDQLRATGTVRRGWLGVTIQDVSAELAERQKMEVPTGALITEIISTGPAADSELRVDDIIVRFNGVQIGKMSELPPAVGSTRVGSDVPVDIIRDGQHVSLDVTLGELASEPVVASTNANENPGSINESESGSEDEDKGARESPEDDNSNDQSVTPRQVFGMTVTRPSSAERVELDLPTDGGLIVRELSSGIGMRAGIKAGDIVLGLGARDIDSVEQFSDIAERLLEAADLDKSATRMSVPILIRRKQRRLFLVLNLK